ncbi:MAG: succinate--CoA ligase subunit alpha [Candidatus Jordarchaeum sp.]|uniref:succinate--CoA ligase subunit alpha n=1 Tax=Candidatus Jordarchaeum sp. TaxID=2823881 RepID=UPI00404B6821
MDKNTRVIVQGITGYQGSFHTKLMLEYGTKIVAGVTPGKSGEEIHGVPVYGSVEDALSHHDANASIVFVPARFCKEAILEAIEHSLSPIVVISEGIPVHDSMILLEEAKRKNVTIIGPNTPGIITPNQCKMGIMPRHLFIKGNVGLVSRSGTLTYEIASKLTNAKQGQSTCLGIGGDKITGLSYIEVLEIFREDSQTSVIVLVSEIGGTMEEETAEFIAKTKYEKPIIAFIAGKTAPPGKTMGHAGAIISSGGGSATGKIKAFKKAGIYIAETPSDVTRIINEQGLQ